MHIFRVFMNSMCAVRIGLTSPFESMESGFSGSEPERTNHFLNAQAEPGIC